MNGGEISRTPPRVGEAERRVVDTFVAWLEERGWCTWREVNHLDVLAERGGDGIRAEAKSHSGENSGIDVDTAFGQLLRAS